MGGESVAEESPEGIVERLRYSLEDRPKWQTPFMAIIVILSEITGGVGPWGAIRPLIATALAIIPFLYLGQHFNRQHSKAFDWTALQVPLLFCLLWPLLWFWSIFDAYQTSMLSVADQYSVA
uniref:Uncharacterized protein n=1 Tax=uncultured marine group II/III euryarchaeote KM3_99_A09 TaxID=1456549 RepID=A0A075I0H0_9EURY|nr:hypothetical protein [uncultured marine group II/III euryarchaeote KM3_99_A09]